MVASVAQSAPGRSLHRDLAARMVDLFRRDGVARGQRLTEQALAARLGVSRTPVRAALARLAAEGVVQRTPGRGHTLARLPDEGVPDCPPSSAAEDALIIAIAEARLGHTLPDEVSESDLIRRFGASRPVVTRALATLADAGVMARKPGYGWRFEPLPSGQEALDESYRFRLLLEPAALLEPGYRLDPHWCTTMRAAHESALRTPWGPTSSVGFFEMNAGFHEGLARMSGNRFVHLAIVQQNRVRRFSNYHWTLGHARVDANCRQHLEILDRLEADENDVASVLLRRHIEQARHL